MSKKIKIIALGSDPEYFLLTKEGNPLSAIGLIGGSKDEPLKLSEEGHFVQEDNVMIEMNIPPCRDKERFYNELIKVKSLSYGILPEGTQIVTVPSLEFDPSQLVSNKAIEVGCSVDFNVHKREANPQIKLNTNFRFAGGHVHVSYEQPDIETTEKIVKCMDLFLGLPSVILDTDTKRKEVYGTAGRFRITDYGLEYRTLSNFWLASKELIQWVFENTLAAVEAASNFEDYEKYIEEAVDIINTNNDKEATLLCKNLKIFYNIKEKVKETEYA
jgi:hypothetical protein